MVSGFITVPSFIVECKISREVEGQLATQNTQVALPRD